MNTLELIPIREWSQSQDILKVTKLRQATKLGFSDDCELYRLLREEERIAVNPITLEVWRKRKERK